MTLAEVAVVAASSAAVATVVTVVVVAGNRARRERRARLAAAVRPVLYGALDRGELDNTTVESLTPAERRALEDQARSLLPKLRGQDHDTLARLLDRRGAVAKAKRETRSRRPATRARAGEFLGEADSADAVLDLVNLLQDDNPEVRWVAARALGRLGHPSAVPPLLAALEGRRALPVDLVADAIFQIRDCPVALLRQGLKSRSVPTRAVTVELLGRFQSVGATGDVIEVLQHDPSFEVRARAARCLGRIGSPHAVEPLLACLNRGPAPLRVQAAWALGELGAVEAVPALRTALVGPSRQLSERAAEALAAIGPAGISVLVRVADSDSAAAGVSRSALSGLESWKDAVPAR
jgi:HEAT repeat protein